MSEHSEHSERSEPTSTGARGRVNGHRAVRECGSSPEVEVP
jgi:hypothetical protein